MFGNTYSLRLVIDFLNSQDIKYKYCNANIGMLLQNHGCRINIDDIHSMSIQTHPMVTGEHFAETALTNLVTQKMVQDGTNGYYDVKSFYDPSELFDHILSLHPQTMDTHTNAVVVGEGDDKSDNDTDDESVISSE